MGPYHWRRLVKNTGGANPNIGGQNVVKTDKCMGDSHILGARPGCLPKSTPMVRVQEVQHGQK